ncbi:MAG: spermidine/putrescine ABC transporter substrate-binding protein [Lachnospiraceae bacterium]|nr:spermidine/putrescine ABC transporter substrate-binding protein [Lachnospiraceae bacterium]
MKRRLSLALTGVLIMGCLSGCGAKETGELNLFTWDGMFPQEILDGFEEETGYRINYTNFDYDEDMLAKLEEAQGGDYDYIIADDYIIEVAIEEGLVQKLDKSKLSNWENINPLYQGQFYDLTDEYTIPHGAGIPLIVYDPSQVSVEITGYEDLWNPSLEDSIAIIGNYRVIEGITLKTLGKSFNTEDLEDITAAGEKLKSLAPNIRLISDSNTQDYLLSGEVSVAFMYTSQVVAAMQANPDLKIVYPTEGLGIGIMAGFIPSDAPNAEAAYAFADYINRPENAAKCFEYLGYYCTNKAAEEYIAEEMRYYLTVPENITETEMIQNISQEAEDLHSRNWNEFRVLCD